MTFDPAQLEGNRLRITGDDLSFDDLDTFAELTGAQFGQATDTHTMRALAVIGLRQRGLTVEWADLGPCRLDQVMDLEWAATEAAAVVGPTDAGA